MKTPRFENAIVEERKIADYLLSDTHPAGRTKAQYFMRFGFRSSDSGVLRRAILEHAGTGAVVSQNETPFGTKYIVEGPLVTPDGTTPVVRTVWITPRGEDAPRFVTAYPVRWIRE